VFYGSKSGCCKAGLRASQFHDDIPMYNTNKVAYWWKSEALDEYRSQSHVHGQVVDVSRVVHPWLFRDLFCQTLLYRLRKVSYRLRLRSTVLTGLETNKFDSTSMHLIVTFPFYVSILYPCTRDRKALSTSSLSLPRQHTVLSHSRTVWSDLFFLESSPCIPKHGSTCLPIFKFCFRSMLS